MKLAKLEAKIQSIRLTAVPQTDLTPVRSSTQMGYNYRWQKARLRHLEREPLCRACLAEGRINDKQLEVDHIIPHRNDPALFWDELNNLQTLCKPHHSAKTARGE